MKTSSKVLSAALIFVFLIVFAGWKLSQAQDATTTDQSGTNVDWNSLSDAQIELMAIEQIPPTPYSQLPEGDQAGGTFWSAQHSPVSAVPWPPLPADLKQLSVWNLSTNNQDQNVFLLDDLSVDYNSSSIASSQTAGTMQLLDSTNPPSPGGGGTNSGGGYTPGGSTPIDTNGLWLQINGISNGLVYLTLNNTTNGVQYQLLSQEVLSNTPISSWDAEGSAFWGSATTNWTAVTVPENGRSNLFLSAQSQMDSTGTGIPDWWWLEYFGQDTNVDAYGDPAGDGWNNLEKYQLGMDPTNFYTPPTPQGLTAVFDSSNSTAEVSWLPSAGPVTGYTIQKYDPLTSQTTTFNVSPSVNGFPDTISDNAGVLIDNFGYDLGPIIDIYYQIQAHYPGGDSAWSSPVLLEPNYFFNNSLGAELPVQLVAGPQGSAYLAASGLPAGTTKLRVDLVDWYAHYYYWDSSFDNTVDIPVSSSTNGLYLLPTALADPPVDSYGQAQYDWLVQTVDASDNPSEPMLLNRDHRSRAVPIYLDGRAQLKENLIFQLRSAQVDRPFQFDDVYSNANDAVSFPTNYAFSGFYDNYNNGTFNALLPFVNNYTYRNFVFNTADLSPNGLLNSLTNYLTTLDFGLTEPAPYSFQLPADTTNSTPMATLLGTNDTRWLGNGLSCVIYFNPAEFDNFYEIGMHYDSSNSNLVMDSGIKNIYGLPFLSTEAAQSSSQMTTLYPGNGATWTDWMYSEVEQPQFQTAAVEYDFWNATNLALPGNVDFSTTTQSQPLFITSVGSQLQIAGYAKLAIQNCYSGVYGYLGQYFTNAYQIDDNGNVTTNTTGLLSPYGQFFATQPGPAALETMPDVDTGEQGTCTVYAISLALDANHDGVMDTSFGGPDNTSPANPYVFWANNNYDRWEVDILSGVPEEDDVLVGDPDSLIPDADPYDPDCNYKDNGQRVIPDTRDLEDYARLWVCGVTSNLLAALPVGSTVTLSWLNEPLIYSNTPTIDIFQAADPDGGMGYLTNETVADEQTNIAQCAYLGRLGPGGSLLLNSSLFTNDWAGNHFIWCGVSNGVGQLNLTISDASGNVLAQASQWIQIADIKQMYERWTVGDNPYKPPLTTPVPAANDLPTNVMQQPFLYSTNTVPGTPYILLVHGWNMERWEKDRYAETAFKRLYWQGYQGRFGELRWPTYYDFPFGAFSWQAFDLRNYDNSEYNAWQSGAGLLNLLTTLDAEYGSANVYLMAHSMGNVVAGEALLLAGSNQVVNTYVAMQAAVPAHCYDPSTPDRYTPNYPDDYAQYWTAGAPSYFNGSASAGAYVNFFNTNDYALGKWTLDQNGKPDYGYGYDGTNFYYAPTLLSTTTFYFPEDTFNIFAYCDPAPCYALGAQAGVEGAFHGNQVNLSADPYDFGDQHIYHSGEFRSDYAQRWQFWDSVLANFGITKQ
jgi:hypothetical protein